MTSRRFDTAMVLAAGLGARMRPLTDTRPKPLVDFCGKALLDHVLDRLAANGITRAVVNIHYLGEQIQRRLAARTQTPEVIVSDEREALLDTGGGVLRALQVLGPTPFVVHNSDSVWVDATDGCNLQHLFEAWDGTRMDCLMLLAEPALSVGYAGKGDFVRHADGVLNRRREGEFDALVYAGVCIMKPELFETAPQGAFSMNVIWDAAIAKKRLFGIVLNGTWMHIGTPEALTAAENWIADAQRN